MSEVVQMKRKPERELEFAAPEFEAVVLAAALHDRADRLIVCAELSEEHFTGRSHQSVFRALQKIGGSDCESVLAIAARGLLDSGELQQVGGFTGLLRIDEQYCAGGKSLLPLLQLLRDKHAEREAYRIREHLSAECELGYVKNIEAVRSALLRFQQLEGTLQKRTATTTLGDAIRGIEGGLNGLLAPPAGHVQTPWALVNGWINGGFQRGELWVVAARTGVGKSVTGMQIAKHAAAGGAPVYFWSGEMPMAMLLKRVFADEANVGMHRLMAGHLAKEERLRIHAAASRCDNYQLAIDDKSKTLSDILGQLAREHYALAVVDHLGLVEVGRKFENRNQEIGYITRSMKRAAIEQDVPLILLSQLNRGNDTQDRPPHISDLRDSGSIEQDADGVLLLHQPSKARKPTGPAGVVQFQLAKQRNGQFPLFADLRIEGEYCRIAEQRPAQTEDGQAPINFYDTE